MKKLLYLLLIIPFLTGATRYVASDGSGNYTTFAAANTAASAGDTIAAKCGLTYREQIIPINGTASAYTTYTSYGTGAKPLILGSKQENNLTDWTDLGSNIWSNNDTSFTVDVGNIIFNNESSCGVKKKTEAELLTQGDFWYDFTNDLIKIYSVGNPASVYTNIECALRQGIVKINYSHHIIIDGIDIRYGASNGIEGRSLNNITIKNCNLSFIGGGDQLEDHTVRFGNGINFWQGASDLLVEKCFFENVMDCAFTNQGDGNNYSVSNINYKNNIADKCKWMYEKFYTGTNITGNNIHVTHNTFTNAGSEWGSAQRWDTSISKFFVSQLDTAIYTNCTFKNNIMSGSDGVAIRTNAVADANDFDMDYNCYNVTTVGKIISTDYTTLADWQLATSQDAHSIAADPLLNSNYKPLNGSPCINAGEDVGVNTDYYGKSRVGTADIGAIEFRQGIETQGVKRGGVIFK
ncbi:MAG: choice-of-anchor Q domain-containing protein [Sulfuricurvum sp.]|nr:choice-of-anchor Q domain-containing protein [Sulfuricurvum sp.]